MEEERLLDVDELPEEIKKEPYSYICNFAEYLYPYTGGKVFEVLALVPCSLLIEDTPYLSKTEKTNMNVLFLAFSGAAKSSLSKLFSKFTYHPIEARSYTPAELENQVVKNSREGKKFSLIIEDYAIMSMDERINKIIEGILGEEKIVDRHTTRKDIRENVEAVGLLCGVPADLSNNITSGLLSRVFCILIVHNDEEHSKIGKYISHNLGKTSGFDVKEKIIKSYYNVLKNIMEGNDEINKPINGVIISQNFKDQIYQLWDERTKKYRKLAEFNYFRELHDGYRVLINHCVLNYFNREKEGNKLIATQQDCDVAIRVLKRDLRTKFDILMSETMGQSIKNVKQLSDITSNNKLSNVMKRLIPMYAKKNGKK